MLNNTTTKNSHRARFQTIKFSICTQFNYQKTFLYQTIQFSQTVLIQTIHFSISTVFRFTQLNVKTVPFRIIHFSVVPFQCQKQFYFKQFSLAYVHSLVLFGP